MASPQLLFLLKNVLFYTWVVVSLTTLVSKLNCLLNDYVNVISMMHTSKGECFLFDFHQNPNYRIQNHGINVSFTDSNELLIMLFISTPVNTYILQVA